jgi:hypothetical protein
VIALHNNSDGAYSALRYAQGGALASDAARVFIKDGSDPDDFFLVTEPEVFEALRRRGYNVVLQDNSRVTDDGSLSVHCGRAGVRYINIEAQHGHLDRQVAMILALHDALEALGQAGSNWAAPLTRNMARSLTCRSRGAAVICSIAVKKANIDRSRRPCHVLARTGGFFIRAPAPSVRQLTVAYWAPS